MIMRRTPARTDTRLFLFFVFTILPPSLDRGRCHSHNEHCSFWNFSMNTTVTSREEILKEARALVRDKGWGSVNIRAIAARCSVSVGSVYNYFSTKNELTIAVVESIWRDIFHNCDICKVSSDIVSLIEKIYIALEKGEEKYPEFFSLHSLPFAGEERKDASIRMASTWEHIRGSIREALRRDEKVRRDAFGGALGEEDFTSVLFSLILGDIIRGHYNPESVIEIVRRTLY